MRTYIYILPVQAFSHLPPFLASARADFRTTLFNFDILKELKIVVREDYDHSVNIYFVDGQNSDKVINSGFNNSDGTQLQDSQGNDRRLYWDKSFPNTVSLSP